MSYCPYCDKNVSIVTSIEYDQNRETNTVNVYSKGDYDNVRHKIGEYENEQVYLTSTTTPRCSLCYKIIDYPEVQSKGHYESILKRLYKSKILNNVDSCKRELLSLQQSKKKTKSKFKTNFSFSSVIVLIVGFVAASFFMYLINENDNAFLIIFYGVLVLIFGGMGLIGLFTVYIKNSYLIELKFNEDIENKIKLKQQELVEKQQELDKILEEEDKETKREFEFMLKSSDLQPYIDMRLRSINNINDLIMHIQKPKKEIKSKFNTNFQKFEFFTSLVCFSLLIYLVYVFIGIKDDIFASIICVIGIIILGIIAFAGIFTMYDKKRYENDVKYNEEIDKIVKPEQQRIDIIQQEIDKIQQVIDNKQGLYQK